MKTLVLIDSNAIVHRAYHALPKTLSNSKGEHTNVTYGFALALIRILEELHPDYIIAAFDLAGPTFRHKEYKEYKATRVKADQELYDQIPRVREMLTTFGIPIYAVKGFEADDILGTLVEQCLKSSKTAPLRQGSEGLARQQDSKTAGDHSKKADELTSCPADELMIYIASGDRDVYQLLNGHVRVLMLKKGFSEAEIFDHDHLKEVYGLDPGDFIDLKALAGDPSDNIPGVPGIGPKTATDLIQRFDTLEKLYKQIVKLLNCSIAELPKQQFNNETIVTIAKQMEIRPRILELLIKNNEQAFMSQSLATIRRDAPIKCDLESARWGQYDREGLRKLFEELEFKSLLKRFSKNDGEAEGKKSRTEGKNITEEQKRKDEQLRLKL